MVHQLMNGLLEAFSIFGLVAGAVILLFWVAERVERVWLHLRRPSRLDYERYRAEEALRSIKRRAVYELLTAEHTHRDQIEHYADVIEGTAVEVRR